MRLSGNGGFNASRLPMLKQLDLRMTKDFRLGKYQFTGYLDARNILNITEHHRGLQPDRYHVERRPTPSDSTRSTRPTFAMYGTGTGERLAERLIYVAEHHRRLRQGHQRHRTPTRRSAIYMIRSEQRFGNGDGIYTLAEQRAASDSHNALANSIWQLHHRRAHDPVWS